MNRSRHEVVQTNSVQIIKSIPDRIDMTEDIFNEIKKTIGKFPAETGGILGMQGDKINKYFYDEAPNWGTRVSYTPNHKAINKVLSEKWTPSGTIYMGAVHSHPVWLNSPSLGDEDYAKRLLDHIMNFDKAKPYFYIPIVLSSADTDEFRIYSYIACYRNEKFCIEAINLYINGRKYEPKPLIQHQIHKPQYKSAILVSHQTPTNLKSTFSVQNKTVICIGVRNVEYYIESLAKCGIENFILIENDAYSKTSEHDMDIIKRRILCLPSRISVFRADGVFHDKITDEEFLNMIGNHCKRTLVGISRDILIANFSHRTNLNQRASELAKNFQVAYIETDTYVSKYNVKVTFNYPGQKTTLLEAKSTSYLNKNHSATDPLNGIRGFICLLLLSYKDQEQFETHIKNYAEQSHLVVDFKLSSNLSAGT